MKITVYSTRTCVYCNALKSWLDQKGVKYNEKRVDESLSDAKKMVKLSGQMGVPFSTIEFDDGRIEKVLGFDRPRFEYYLQTAK